MREGDADLLRTYFQSLYDRILVLTKDNNSSHSLDSADRMIQGLEYLTQIAHLFPGEMRADVQNIVLANLRGYEEAIGKKTKRVEGPVRHSEGAYDTYLEGISQKQINYNM